MGAITSWLTAKGLELSAECLSSALEIPSAQALLEQNISEINTKLDQLIQAPYLAALVHLREGEIEKAKDGAIQAFCNDPFNLPARLLYICLLRFLKKYPVALDEYWCLLESFPYRHDLVPTAIYDAFTKDLLTWSLPASKPDSSVRFGTGAETKEFYPASVWCSPGGLAIRWKRNRKLLFILRYEQFVVSVVDWDGRVLFESSNSAWSPDEEISMVTPRYFVTDNGVKFVCRQFSDGKPVRGFEEDEFSRLFLPQYIDYRQSDLFKRSFCEGLFAGKSFGNIRLTKGSYEDSKEWTEIDPQYGVIKGGFNYQGGTVEFKISDDSNSAPDGGAVSHRKVR